MNIKHLWQIYLGLLLCGGILHNVTAAEVVTDSMGGDTLVVVKQVVGTDRLGKDHVLYNEQSGRVYRLSNIEQAVLDLSSGGIKDKGAYYRVRAVLDQTVYVMDRNNSPRPAQIEEAGIDKVVELQVGNLLVSKDNVTVVYNNNCRHLPSDPHRSGMEKQIQTP